MTQSKCINKKQELSAVIKAILCLCMLCVCVCESEKETKKEGEKEGGRERECQNIIWYAFVPIETEEKY